MIKGISVDKDTLWKHLNANVFCMQSVIDFPVGNEVKGIVSYGNYRFKNLRRWFYPTLFRYLKPIKIVASELDEQGLFNWLGCKKADEGVPYPRIISCTLLFLLSQTWQTAQAYNFHGSWCFH